MATKAVIGRGLREAGAALKHASGMEVCATLVWLCQIKFLVACTPVLDVLALDVSMPTSTVCFDII